MDRAPGAIARVVQRREVVLAILVVDEAVRAVIAALNDVEGMAGQDESEWTWHATIDTATPRRSRHRIPACRATLPRLL